MALEETMTVLSSSQDGDYDGTDDGSHEMPRLSMEGFDADAEVEFSDDKDGKVALDHSSDSEKEVAAPSSWLSGSLPANPRRRRMRGCGSIGLDQLKDYASENDARKRGVMRRKTGRSSGRANVRGDGGGGFSTESEGGSGGGGGGVVVITRPKGGRQSLCMDLEEVKACRDLGFELEHQRTVELPSSGGDSPIADWGISSPGDDPRDVKARLKTWAQAVALASSARHSFF